MNRKGSRSVGISKRPWAITHAVAVATVVAATLLRMALSPLIGDTTVPFITFFPAVLFTSWFGGFRAGALSLMLSVFAADYYFVAPVGTLLIRGRHDQVTLLIFLIVGFGMALLSHSQRRALERAHHAESAERAERQRFETTLASIGDAVLATDAEGRVTFANKVALSLLGRTEGETIGNHLDEVFRIVNEYTRAAVESLVAKVLREGIACGLANHTVLIARNATEVPIDDSAAPIRDEHGAVRGTVLVFRDITARRQAEQTGRLLASIVENSGDAIISKDLRGVVTSWNAAAEGMFGYSAQEMIGQSISVLAAADQDEMPGILERIQRGERLDHYRTVRRTKAGALLRVSITVSPVHDAIGRITGASKIVRDITAEVQAQEEVAEQRERLRVTLSSIGDAVVTTDVSGQVLYLNPVAEQLTGWTSAEARGRPLEEVFRIVNEFSRETVENPAAKVLQEGRIVGLANHTVLIARDGREVFIDDSAAPIRDQGGAVQGTVLVFRDIGERRAMERELHESAERLRTALDAGRMGVWDWNIRSGKVNWSPSLEAIHGLAPGSFGGTLEAYMSDVHPDDLAYVRQSIARAVEQKTDHDIEYRIRWTDGSVHWIHAKGRVLLDASGNTIGMTGICMDLTERKQSDQWV